jgi:hypothetical protein
MKRIVLWASPFFIMLALYGLIGLAGCSSDSAGQTETGNITIGLTDAEGDFVTYAVDVVSLTLTHANGTVVEALPLTTRVDFAQYVDMTELLTAASVPLGAYKKATLSLDYSTADIRVENSAGEIIAVTTLVDENDDPVGHIDMDVYLENRSALVVAPGLLSHITLDFDLAASNSVTIDEGGLAHVTVAPVLLADVNHESPKTFRLRGTLDEVLTDDNSFFVNVCPFYHRIHNADDRPFGRLMVVTDDETVYEIDGMTLTGMDGLTLLADQPSGISIVAMGKMKTDPIRFEAQSVYVGTSVPGTTSDVITGHVIGRDGDTLSVNGMVFIKDEARYIMNDTVRVTLSEDTVVTRRDDDGEQTTDAVAPGQRVIITGDIDTDDAENLSMTADRILMDLTVLKGRVTDNPESAYLSVSLESIASKPVDMFDFSGTGSTVENDADPAAYEIETGDLDITDLVTDDLVRIWGFVNAFGQAPYDFAATAIDTLADRPAFFKVHWKPFSSEPFTLISDERLEVNLEGTRTFHHLLQALCLRPLQDLEETPAIVPGEEGVYVIIMRGGPQVFTDFGEFTARIQTELEGSVRAKKLFVKGTYDDASATLTARYLTLFLH